METPPATSPEHPFSHYEANAEDLRVLIEDVDTVYESGLIEQSVLDELRFVLFDSRHLYVCTRGTHRSTPEHPVEELRCGSASGFRIFKIPHRGCIGLSPKDYKGGVAWLLCDELEHTAPESVKRVNGNKPLQPTLPQPDRILDTVALAPVTTVQAIHKDRYSYLTDLVFHEAAHIEQRVVSDWHVGDSPDIFPSDLQHDLFFTKMRSADSLPIWLTDLALEHASDHAVREMYAMTVDREAARRYEPGRIKDADASYATWVDALSHNKSNSAARKTLANQLASDHVTGRLLVRILEEQFPNFEERKAFVQSVLRPVRERVRENTTE